MISTYTTSNNGVSYFVPMTSFRFSVDIGQWNCFTTAANFAVLNLYMNSRLIVASTTNLIQRQVQRPVAYLAKSAYSTDPGRAMAQFDLFACLRHTIKHSSNITNCSSTKSPLENPRGVAQHTAASCACGPSRAPPILCCTLLRLLKASQHHSNFHRTTHSAQAQALNCAAAGATDTEAQNSLSAPFPTQLSVEALSLARCPLPSACCSRARVAL